MKNNDNLQCLEMFETVKGSIGDTLQIVVIQGPGILGGGGRSQIDFQSCKSPQKTGSI